MGVHEFSAFIRDEIERLGLKRKTLLQLLQISPSGYHKIIQGDFKHEPRRPTIEKLATALGTTVDHLVGLLALHPYPTTIQAPAKEAAQADGAERPPPPAGWLTEEEVSNIITAMVTRQVMIREFIQELSTSDVGEANLLRKAILSIIICIQDDVPEEMQELFNYLLTDFHHLSDAFSAEHIFPLLPEGGGVMRWNQSGKVSLLVKNNFWKPKIQAELDSRFGVGEEEDSVD